MKREYLSPEDHRKVADELRHAEGYLARARDICSGKVPAALIDQLCSPGKLSLAMMRLREDLLSEMWKRHPEARDVYYSDRKAGETL